MYVSPEERPTLSRRLSRASGGSLSATRNRNEELEGCTFAVLSP
jgi:hypothetical protein